MRGKPRKRKTPEEWNANIQKRRRMEGQSYLGRRKEESVVKLARKIGVACQSAVCQRSSKLHCHTIDEGKREEIFKYFRKKLDWNERNIYVKSLVEVSSVLRRRTLATDSVLFLSTLSIKQWSFLKWVGRRGESPEKTARVRVRSEEQDYAKSFLLDLPKVPSHYCRSSSSKLYLEP